MRSGSRNVNGFGNGNKKPTSSLSKIGKHAPPPISPIINLKSTSFSGTEVKPSNSSNLSIVSSSNSSEKSELAVSNGCAWRIPKSNDIPVNSTPSATTTTKYPQRKVPALTPEPVVKEQLVVERREEAKSFFERYEEFPDLQGKKHSNSESASSIPSSIQNAPSIIPVSMPSPAAPSIPPPSSKLVGGEFNFLEDDDWLDGDTIDYTQDLFHDTEHFLPTLPSLVVVDIPPMIPELHEVVKAKTLLAERSHSSKKKDIWKRTTNNNNISLQSTVVPLTEESKVKIKILKRPDVNQEISLNEFIPPLEVNPMESKLIKKFKTSLKLTTQTPLVTTAKNTSIITSNITTTSNTTTTSNITTTSNTNSITESSEKRTEEKPKKIVYSSASKTLQIK